MAAIPAFPIVTSGQPQSIAVLISPTAIFKSPLVQITDWIPAPVTYVDDPSGLTGGAVGYPTTG